MDIARTRDLLDRIPARSDYEFRNFEIESQGSWHRQVRYVLRQKETITDHIDCLSAEIDRKNMELELQHKIMVLELAQLSRRRRDLEQQLSQVDAWIDAYEPSEFEDAVAGFEASESDNWSETLGREIGVEVLADKQASKLSLMQASLLPLADYKKSVIITNQFATFLKKTAEQAEGSIAVNRPASMPTAAPDIAPDVVAEMAELRDKMVEAAGAELPDDAREKKKKKKK